MSGPLEKCEECWLVWFTRALSFAGKFGIAGAFDLLYVYTSEIFPTVTPSIAIYKPPFAHVFIGKMCSST